jgi:hypothetical protein
MPLDAVVVDEERCLTLKPNFNNEGIYGGGKC